MALCLQPWRAAYPFFPYCNLNFVSNVFCEGGALRDKDTVAFMRLLNVSWRGNTITCLQPWRFGYNLISAALATLSQIVSKFAFYMDMFEEKKSILEPTAITSRANMNFDRLRLVRDLTNVGRQQKAVLATFMPETPASFKQFGEMAEEGPNYALMAFSSSSSNSEVSNDSTCSKSCLETVKLLKSQNNQLLKDLKKFKLMVLGYKIGLKSVEERLEFYKTNKSIYLEDIKVLKIKIQMGEIAIKELRKKLEIAQKEKDGIQLNVYKFEHASKSLNKLIECEIVDSCKKGLRYENYNAVSPPYTGNFMPLTLDLPVTDLDEFVNKPVVENCKAKYSEEEPKVVRKNDDAPIIEESISGNEEEDVSQPKIIKKTVRPSIAKIEFVKSKQQEKTARKIIKQVE
nr:threonine dehydratase biosynthetic, chloroplastic-like [Tanacetum cinerariifolium]